MVPIVLMLCVAQGFPRWSEHGKHEAWTPRPSRRQTGGDQALMTGLDWLVRNQEADGSWEAGDGESKVGVTALALLAFLGAGFTTWAQEDCAAWGCRTGPSSAYGGPKSSQHLAVRRAIGFLLRSQDADGFIGLRGSPLSFRDHAIAAQALSEACGNSHLRGLAEAAGRAIQAMEGDEGALGWTTLALRSAASWRVPYARSLNETDVPAPLPPGPVSLLRGALEVVFWRERLAIRRKEDWKNIPSIQPLLDRPPSWKPGEIDPQVWYWGTMAILRYDGKGGPSWKKWSASLKQALLQGQDLGGSWAPPGRSRAGSTALFCLTLTVHDPAVFGVR